MEKKRRKNISPGCPTVPSILVVEVHLMSIHLPYPSGWCRQDPFCLLAMVGILSCSVAFYASLETVLATGQPNKVAAAKGKGLTLPGLTGPSGRRSAYLGRREDQEKLRWHQKIYE